MKKLLFVFAFAFIGEQAYSQMYIVAVRSYGNNHPSNCANINTYDAVMTTIDPQGNLTYDCMYQAGHLSGNGSNIVLLNQKFNSILSQGYKLVSTDADSDINGSTIHGAWYFAIP